MPFIFGWLRKTETSDLLCHFPSLAETLIAFFFSQELCAPATTCVSAIPLPPVAKILRRTRSGDEPTRMQLYVPSGNQRWENPLSMEVSRKSIDFYGSCSIAMLDYRKVYNHHALACKIVIRAGRRILYRL